MSIMSSMQQTQVFNPLSVFDSLNRPIKNGKQFEEEPFSVIDMCINVQTQQSANRSVAGDIRYQEVTHLGLTMSKDIVCGQLIRQGNQSFIVHLTPNTKGRLTQVCLKEVISNG